MTCACGSDFQCRAIEEWDAQHAMLCYTCRSCGFHLGIEANNREASGFFARPVWTDEAQHRLDRLPPYVAPLVQQEVEAYAVQHRLALISTGLMMQARHHGLVSWHPDAERRLSRVPAAVRAMARAELERTAQDREMPEVTVALMDDITGAARANKAKAAERRGFIELLFKWPYCKIGIVEKSLGCSRLTATRYLNEMTNLKLLERIQRGREYYYVNSRLIDLLAD